MLRITIIGCFILLSLSYQSLIASTIVIDNKTYTIDTLANFKVGPGTWYTGLRLKSNNRLDVYFLKVDATNPYITFKAAIGRDSIYNGEQPSALAKRKSKEGAVYFAGTNGDFYVTQGYVGYPVAGCMVDKEIARIPTTARKIVAFDVNKIPGIGSMSYSGEIKAGTQTREINSVNHLREENQLVLYNQHNGKVTRTNAYGTEILVQLLPGESWGVNKTIRVKITKKEQNTGSMAIPKNMAVLSGHGTAATFLNTLNINDEIEITQNLVLDGEKGDYTQIVGGDNRNPMLKDGIMESSQVWNELHPRTAIGYSQDKKTVIFCVVDGRGLSAGVTTKQLAELMKSAGAYTAFNMDGGGSSCMYVKDFGPMNVPSDGTERAVANSLFAVSTAPTDNTVAEIKAYNTTIKLPRFGVFKPGFLGYNQFGVLIDKNLQNVTLSCEPLVGEIATDGSFIATGEAGGMVTATFNNISTQFRVELITSAVIAFRLDSVLIDSRREYPVEVQSKIGLNTMNVLPAALTWESGDSTVCSVENGVLKGLKNGSTYIFGTLGDFRDTLKVTVEIPDNWKIVADSFKTTSWKLEASAALNAALNQDNLPENWSYGAVVNFVFNATRAPFIKLTSNLNLYSLPDTIKFTFNMGDVSCSKLIYSFRANNSSTDLTKEFTVFTQNADITVAYPLATMFNTSDIAIYPVRFNYMNFYLNSQTNGQAYRLALKDITLCYKGYAVSGISLITNRGFSVYPNPTKNKQIILRTDNKITKPIKVSFYTTNGQLIFSDNISSLSGNEHTVSVDKLKPGTYFIKIDAGYEQFSSTLIIQ